MDMNNSKSCAPEEDEKKVSAVLKEMDLADRVWERFTRASSGKEVFQGQEAASAMKVQSLYSAFLLLYNDINKALRPGPHRDPPSKKEVFKYFRSYGDINESMMLNRVEFNDYFESFTKNAVRRDDLQAFFKVGTNQHDGRSKPHAKQGEADCSSQEKGGVDCEDLKAPAGGWNVLRHGRTDSAVNLNSFSGGSHFQIFNFAGADLDSLATFVKQIRR